MSFLVEFWRFMRVRKKYLKLVYKHAFDFD
jgi:hypothetical protein